MPGTCQLLCTGEPGRARTDDSDPLAGSPLRYCGLDPPLLPPPIHDCAFDRFDRDRIVVDVERARRLTGRRTDAAGEFREVVGGVKGRESGPPLVAVDQIIPVRD